MTRKLRYFIFGRLFPCALILFFTAAGIIALSVYLPVALLPIAAIERFYAFAVCVSTLRRKELPETRTAWTLIVLLLPWTGATLRLLKGNPFAKKNNDSACADFYEDAFTIVNAAIRCGAKPCFAKTAEYFPTGKDFFPRFLADLAEAERFIWLEYYIVERGELWNSVLALLRKKAKEGLDVRLIYDDFGCASTLPKNYANELERFGIQAFPFRKLHAFPLYRLNGRDHRKCAVIDGKTVYTGGINLADEYIGIKIKYGHWKDTAIRLTGEPARVFAEMFAKQWNRHSPHGIRLSSENPEKGTVRCAAFYDDPAAYYDRVCPKLYRMLISRAEKTLYLCTPYLAANAELIDALTLTAQTGTDVRVMIPHIPDKKSVLFLTRRYARILEKEGVKVREYSCGFLHQKTMTADGKISVVCSYNFDFRSLYLQYECGVLLEDETLTQKTDCDFLSLWEQGVPVPKAGAMEKAVAACINLFSPLF